ncbi:retron system putative HNH endonuclease [Methylicorpusculum sp.]|uniref:retron system putative HNH endonuclease n=1 Tax=Methylicorpusculum sp. TaxID=2713644 RepID=UPI00272004A5|nr:retron system putative HNH endonuclease [Methylicorpusculum sp.]MDO8845441.1 retron system putative HNH endonuclease [Methylicorpusculum sp.]
MRTIRKNTEPTSLTVHRQSPYSDYDNYRDKDVLRQSLVEEQRGLCCYCQSRIHPNISSMKIEHWECQDNYPGRQLDYQNLLGACLGGKGRTKREQYCDTRKDNDDLCFCLTDPAHPIERQIRFLGNGEITSDNVNIKNAINDILNLNRDQLVTNRRAVLDAFKQRLGKGPLNAARELEKWNGSQPGELPEYAQVMVFWLEKKIARNRA